MTALASTSADMADNHRAAQAESAVVLEDAAVALGGRTIWQHANLSIAQGALVGLIGPNGTGKTTLLRVLLGQVRPSAGKVVVLGGPPRRGNAQIGYVPQRRTLEADLALRGSDLVLLGLVGHRWGFGPASVDDLQQMAEALVAVGAERFADQPVGVLSGGEQQRLLIAQALLTHPRLLLLDEPLASLDLRSQHEIVHLVDNLRCPSTRRECHPEEARRRIQSIPPTTQDPSQAQRL